MNGTTEKVFYFGAWSVAGHYIFTSGGRSPVPYLAGPWCARELDRDGYEERSGGRVTITGGGFCPPDPEQPQGVWKLTRAPGWTAIGCWDRTQDSRKGSRSVFVAEGEHDEAAMRDLAARRFPAVWARIHGTATTAAGSATA